MAETREIKIYINGKEVENNIKSIRGEMNHLINSQAQMTRGTKEYIDAGKSIKQLKTIMAEHNDTLKASGTAWKNMIGQMTGVAGGIGMFELAKRGVGAVTGFFKKSTEAAIESEKANAKLLYSLEDLNGAYERMVDLATQLQETTVFDDEDIKAAMSYLGEQNRTEAQIRKTITAATDLAKVLGTDILDATKKLDASYEGNTKGLARLDGRIKELSKSELANGAAVDIIAEKYKGIAENELTTTAGQIEHNKHMWEEFLESMGGKTGGVFSFVNRQIGNLIEKLRFATTSINELKDTVLRNTASEGAQNAMQQIETTTKTLQDKWNMNYADASKKAMDYYVKGQNELIDGLYARAKDASGPAFTALHDRITLAKAELAEVQSLMTKLKTTLGGNDDKDKTKAGKDPKGQVSGILSGLGSAFAAEFEKGGQAADEFKQKLLDMDDELWASMQNDDAVALNAIDKKYDKLFKEAKNNAEMIKQIEDLKTKEILAYYDKVTKAAEKAAKKTGEIEERQLDIIREQSILFEQQFNEISGTINNIIGFLQKVGINIDQGTAQDIQEATSFIGDVVGIVKDVVGIAAMFDTGGYTGPGSTSAPAGVVHKDEYVIPSAVRRDPQVANFERIIESKRRQYYGLPGYESGGPVVDPATGGSNGMLTEVLMVLVDVLKNPPPSYAVIGQATAIDLERELSNLSASRAGARLG